MAVKINEALKLQEIKSESKAVKIADITELQEAVKKYLKSDAVIVAWQLNAVLWGKTENGNIALLNGSDFNLSACQEIRIFNENAELHLIRKGKALVGRVVIDGSGNNCSVVDSISPMWGKSTKVAAGYTEMTDEARKLYLDIPAEIAVGKYCGLVTRNYVVTDEETGLSGYGDYRFLALQELEV